MKQKMVSSLRAARRNYLPGTSTLVPSAVGKKAHGKSAATPNSVQEGDTCAAALQMSGEPSLAGSPLCLRDRDRYDSENAVGALKHM